MPLLFQQIIPLQLKGAKLFILVVKEQSEKINKALYECCQINNDANQR